MILHAPRLIRSGAVNEVILNRYGRGDIPHLVVGGLNLILNHIILHRIVLSQ